MQETIQKESDQSLPVQVEATPFTEEHIFEMLSNQRRRYTLHYLKQHEKGVVEVRELAEQVAAWECGKSTRALTADERKSVKNALHQFHLPKMDDYNLIEYESRRGVVTLTDAADNLEVYIEIVPQRDIPWGPYYFLFTILHLPVLAGKFLGIEPLAGIPWAAFAVFFVVGIAVSAFVHTYDSYSRMRLGTSAPDIEEGQIDA